jgi:hypothetical protein
MDPGVMTFSGLKADTDYYVYARAAAKGEYAPGEPAYGDSFTTDPEGESSSVRGNWNPNPTYTTNNRFTISPATPVSSGRTVEYALSSGATAPTNGWSSTTPITWSINALGSENPTQTQYKFWARTAAGGENPAGIALDKEVALPGARLTNVDWVAEGAPAGPTSATIYVSGELTKQPDITQLDIQYGLGKTQPTADVIQWSTEPPVNGAATVSGLEANTTYYIYARTKAANNFAAGPALLYNSTATVTTISSSSNAGALMNQLNGITPGSATLASTPNKVILGNKVVLDANIMIPPGVTLELDTGSELDARYFDIGGGGRSRLLTGS